MYCTILCLGVFLQIQKTPQKIELFLKIFHAHHVHAVRICQVKLSLFTELVLFFPYVLRSGYLVV